MSDSSKIKQLEESIKTLEVNYDILQKSFNEYVTNMTTAIHKLLNDVHNDNVTKDRVEHTLEEYIDKTLNLEADKS